MTSHMQMELYMSAINPHIAKALRTNIHSGSRYATTSVGDTMKKAEECYLKDLYAWTGLEKDREKGNANKEVMCAEINTRGWSQWQSRPDRQRTWTPQENQENRNISGLSRSYDKWNSEDNIENRTYRDNNGSNRGTEMSQVENKQSQFSENSQHSQPAAVAK